MWNFFVSFSLTNNQMLLKWWKTWPNISLLLSRHRRWWKTCTSNENIFWSSLLMVWLLVSGSWHEETEGKMKLFHCHTLNLVPSCLCKHISSSFNPMFVGMLASTLLNHVKASLSNTLKNSKPLPVLELLRELSFRSCFSCVGQSEVSD